MAAYKEYVFTVAETAFMLDNKLGNQEAVTERWTNLVLDAIARGEEMVTWLWDIYDEVADRNGDAWELLSDERDFEDLKAIYSRSAA